MPFSFSLFGLFNLLDLASLSTTNAVSFLGSLALFCCAQLPKMMRWNGKKGAHEQPSAMVSTSPITASSCSSPGCCGSVAVARSFFDRSLHRHSTARAVLRQKKKGLNERATAATSAPALSSAGMHSPLRAIHSRKKMTSVTDRMASKLAFTFTPWDPMPASLFDFDREQPQARHGE